MNFLGRYDYYILQRESIIILNELNIPITLYRKLIDELPFDIPILECQTISESINIIARLKFHFNRKQLKILYRGQNEHHNFNQIPSYYRNEQKNQEINSSLLAFLYGAHIKGQSEFRIPEKFGINRSNIEPLLQHYGMNTRYIDLVETFDIASWFSIINLDKKEYISSGYCYIFIYGIRIEDKIAEGIYDGEICRLVNLSEASDYNSSRPHRQHAYALTTKQLLNNSSINENEKNFQNFVLAVIKIKKSVVLEHLVPGSQTLDSNYLKSHAEEKFKFYFPSPNEDLMYSNLVRYVETTFSIYNKSFNFPKFGYDFNYSTSLKDDRIEALLIELKINTQITLEDYLAISEEELYENRPNFEFYTIWHKLRDFYPTEKIYIEKFNEFIKDLNTEERKNVLSIMGYFFLTKKVEKFINLPFNYMNELKIQTKIVLQNLTAKLSKFDYKFVKIFIQGKNVELVDMEFNQKENGKVYKKVLMKNSIITSGGKYYDDLSKIELQSIEKVKIKDEEISIEKIKEEYTRIINSKIEKFQSEFEYLEELSQSIKDS